MKNNTKNIVITAMFAALCCVATMVIKIPSPLKGYINLGDCIVLTAGWLLSPHYAFLAAGLGSALADFLSGYTVYVPATLIIKGSMALIVCIFKNKTKFKDIYKKLFSSIIAEVLMILGYFVFEGFLYGFGPSIVNIPMNSIQGAVGIIIALYLTKVFDKTKIFDEKV